MLGAMGAMCSFAACAAAGMLARERVCDRLAVLTAWRDGLEAMKLLLLTERLAMDELLMESAKAIRERGAEGRVRLRLTAAAEALGKEPSLTVAQAYERACAAVPLAFEACEERGALELLFASLGSGTAEMRERAAECCLRRMALYWEKAREKAEKSGKLYAQLGIFGGMMLGIVLW